MKKFRKHFSYLSSVRKQFIILKNTLKGQNLRLIYQRNILAISISNDRLICSDLLRYFTDSIFNPERVNLNNWLTIWNRGNAHMYIRNAISEKTCFFAYFGLFYHIIRSQVSLTLLILSKMMYLNKLW